MGGSMDGECGCDPIEAVEWIDAFKSVLEEGGPEKASYLLHRVLSEARNSTDVKLPFIPTTSYVNTIPASKEEAYPGDLEIERRINAYVCWNATAMVLRGNRGGAELGGHIATFQSAATLYDVGFSHFWRASRNQGSGAGDVVYMQGHSSPGIYSRAFLEGRLTEENLLNFRREVDGNGLSSYPHPWLMPTFWQVPTVSMGLGLLMGIYQAKYFRYLHNRGILNNPEDRKVWVFCGDGELDEPESLGAIPAAGREGLDNLIAVVNCNLQRLDGPVRGNGKIIQELESVFRGAGWNVIKVVWGSDWDPLLARDQDGNLRKLMEECLDGEYQTYKFKGGSSFREEFFGRYPETAAIANDYTDEELGSLLYGGHDPIKVNTAYKAALAHKGSPTVILAKTVKGFGMGKSGEAQMFAHQAKKMDIDSLKVFREQFDLPLTDAQLEELPFIKFPEDSREFKYIKDRRGELGGYLPSRREKSSVSMQVPELSNFSALLESSEDREFSSTMAVVRMLGTLLRDKDLGSRIVPIVADESRTLVMDGLFRQYGIFSQVGQLYSPQDADQFSYYREEKTGQVLQEGINELGALASWVAAATSYSHSDTPMVPFYVYYSMFGFQRVGDMIWAAADARARGFLIGGTSGRSTLNGEGLQHQDGHSHVISSTVPTCVSYDPAFAYEVAVIIREGLKRMLTDQEDIFYYLTVTNANHTHPAMPEGVEQGILKGMYPLKDFASKNKKMGKVNLLGSGAILREVEAAAELLESDYGIGSTVWSVPSFTELRREAAACEEWSTMHPDKEAMVPYVTSCLEGKGPVVAATDYVALYPDQIRPYISNPYKVLGTDGFGRSDTREQLRSFFGMSKFHVVVSALKLMAESGVIPVSSVVDAISRYGLASRKGIDGVYKVL